MRFLSVDVGASGGKAFLVSYNEERIKIEEVHRFPNIPVEINRFTYWNILEVHRNILKAIEIASEKGDVVSLGIDTWGVDFGLLDENGFIIGLPLHYRNTYKWNTMEETVNHVGKQWIFDRAPTQFQPFNTLYQIIGMKEIGMRSIECSRTLLGISSLLVYFLTGKKTAEFTWAATTQLYNPEIKNWDPEIVKRFGIPDILPKIAKPATTVDEVNLYGRKIKIVFPATHDTGSAFACANEGNTMIVSTGTWFLEGIIVKEPVRNEKVMEYNFANEGCMNGEYRFLSNVTGMWLIEELRRQWNALEYEKIIEMAKSVEPFSGMIDVDSTSLQSPDDMEISIKEESLRFSKRNIESRSEILRTAFEGIALKTRWVKERIEEISDVKIKKIRMVGGATRNQFMCQLIANASGLPVEAGPVEATAIGNGLAQMIANGVVSFEDATDIVRKSFEIKRYEPKEDTLWESAYEEFLEYMKVK